MKLEDIKAPEGFAIRGYQMPAEGEYVLCSDNVARRVSVDDFAYHCAGIVLEPVWEPEIGALYEFSDDNLSFADNEYGIFSGYNKNVNSKFKYRDEEGTAWASIRPIKVPIGK